ncbi:protein TOPAZ1 isoform X2 [Tachysurus fulvidraco]|uniref:protein TOPAZ1 isoform X2 n=1 Tax=Tachysurus fulvidraco TaxID=1234273 RepID=UPI001FEE1054|nr:protein TOPAZ1 isoform X2 [Tachysurus fulvidraco]
MQQSNGGPRIKLNRNAFKLEQGLVPKKRRLTRLSVSGCNDSVASVHATDSKESAASSGSVPHEPASPGPQDAHQQEPSRVTCYKQGLPMSYTSEPRRATCTLADCNRNNNNNTLRRKQIRCHVHLALRFCGSEKSAKISEGQQRVSYTVSRYVNRVNTSSSSEDVIEPNAGSEGKSVANQGVSRSGVNTEETRLGAPVKKDGQAACLRSNFNRKAGLRKHFGSISRLGSGRQVKRSVKNACCALCGDVKYTPPAPKKLAHACKAGSRHPSQPRRLEQSVVYPVAQAKMTTRLIIWFRRHLNVKLCDIAHVFDVTSRDFSCILPAVLLQKMKHKKVKCFSKEFRSLMRLDSQGSGNCGKWIGNQSWEVCTTTNSCASLSSGNQVLGFSVGDWKLDVAEDIEGLSESSNKNALRMPDCERIRLSPAVGTACVLLKPGAAQHCIETADYGAEGSRMASEVQEDKTAPVHRVPPLFLRRVHACNGISSSQNLQHVDLSDKYIVSETDTSDRCLVENGLNARPEGDDDCPDCFSCQRTTAYVAKPQFSCARTYRSWPFPRNGHSCKMMPLVRTGPRWIVNTDASEGTNYVIDNMQVGFITTSEYSVEKNMKESVIGFEPHDGSVLVQNSQVLVQPTTQFDQVFDSATPKETSKDQSEGHKNPVKDLTSVSTDGECTKHNCTVFQQDPSSLGSVHVSDSQPVEVMNTNTLMVSPVASISTMDIKSVDLADSSINRAQSSMSSGCLEDNENGTENPLPDLQQSAFQTSHIQHSREEPQTPTVMVHYSVEPKPPSTIMSQSNEEQICDPDIENRSPCSLNILYTNTTEESTSSRTCTGSSTQDTPFKSPTNRDFLSSSDKDFRSMCPAERSEEGATECSLLQDEMRKIDKANRSPSPPPIPEGSVVTGNDLDVMRAYEDDAIVLDVIQDDPDLFGDIAMSSVGTASKANPAALQRGKNTCMQTDKTSLVRRPGRIVWGLETKRKTVQTGGDVHVENNDDFCRGEVDKLAMSSKSQLTYGTDCAPLTPVVQKEQMVPDFNNNLNNIQTADLYVNTVNPGWTWPEGDAHNNVHTTSGKDINIVRPSLPSYCRYYFSEHHTCLRSICWFLHAPRKDDEKFCMDIVQKFCCVGNPPLVQRAAEIFVSYYRASSPAVSFSENVVKQLLSSLLSLALLKDLVAVINTLLTHKRLPPPELVMALYEHVRERGTINFVPELIHLTSKITEAGCVFSVEQCEMMQLHLEFLHVARHQMDVFCAVKCRALATNPHTAELSELAQAVVQVELCKQQEDWHTLAHVFCTVCGGRYSAGELSRFCCCVTMALLKDTKDKLTLPYEPFAESVWQEVPTDEMIKSFLGRVGVSLMFNYYRAQDWTKGLKLLYVMDRLQMEFTVLKGLFSSENGASRCQLITIATELFINNGSIEGALNLLKANEWFVSSSVWPCDQADLQNRKRVLTLLADKTSYRDTLEVLTNLPGLKQPIDGVQASEYNTMFNAHLRRCVMSHVLPVGADTLEFMLTQGIQLDTTELQQLIHKLGKQNSWSRARTLFKRAYSAGYYSGVVWEEDSLALPCCLTEIEMTLAFEMFVACICTSFKNPIDSSRPLIITLKRRSGHEVAMESVYLAAGCRLLSAALIPNPKLNIRYTAASQEQEQLFNLDRGSAAKWFSHNRSWARGLWENSHTLKKAETAFQ